MQAQTGLGTASPSPVNDDNTPEGDPGAASISFRDELGTISGETAKIHADPTVQPRFCKPISIPYALIARVEAELERLETEGIIKPVRSSDWAAPIVPVVKHDGSIRVCGDYKLTANKAAIVDSYPMPRVEDCFPHWLEAKHSANSTWPMHTCNCSLTTHPNRC